MLRNFSRLDIYLNRLLGDIYPQPSDEGHTAKAHDVFNKWVRNLHGVETVLDAGCGDVAFMKSMFESIGAKYTGIALGVNHPDVINMDYTFTEFEDYSFDLIFARHSLEHSPMPIITLMEWERIGRHFLCLVLPKPNSPEQYVGRNHYSVTNIEQLTEWLTLSGWKIIWNDTTDDDEIRLMCQKKGR